MRIVILGCGRTGAQLALDLVAEGHQVTVIDANPDSFHRLGVDFEGDTVLGTGIDEDVLREAGIEQADAFIATTNGDNTNVMAAQVAREVFKVPQVICRIYDLGREEFYRDTIGLTTISPTRLGVAAIRQQLRF
jgi:trk system potassium uptake protein TrkA